MKVLLLTALIFVVSCNQSKITKKTKEAKAGRKIASIIVSESDYTKSYQDLKSEFLTLRSADNFSAYLSKLEKTQAANLKSSKIDYDQLYITSNLLALKSFKGIFHRLKTLVEDKNTFLHQRILSQILSVTHRVALAAPQADHLKAVMDYFSIPVGSQFKKESDLQNFFLLEFVPNRLKQASALKTILRAQETGKVSKLLFDRKFVFGHKAFKDGLDQHSVITAANISYTLSGVYGAIQKAYAFNAYNINGLATALKSVSRLYVLDTFGGNFTGDINGVTTKSIVKKFRAFAAKNRSFLTLKQQKYTGSSNLVNGDATLGQYFMRSAYKYMRYSFTYYDKALSLGEVGGNQIEFFNNRVSWATDNESEQRRATIKEMLEVDSSDIKALNSCLNSNSCSNSVRVNGRITRTPRAIDVKKFYYSTPKSLLDLLPNNWDSEKVNPSVRTYKNGKKYRNYLQFLPRGSKNISELQKLLPGITNQTTRLYISDVRQSYGRWILNGIPLSAIVL